MAANKVQGTSALTSDYGHGLGSALSQNSACKDMAASFRVQVTTAVYCIFAAKNCTFWSEFAGNWSERELRLTINW